MKLSDEQYQKMQSYLKRNRPVLIERAEGYSRRIEGEIDKGVGDLRAYSAVLFYIERGLGSERELVHQAVMAAWSAQAMNNNKYLVGLFSYGWDDRELHHSGRNLWGNRYPVYKPWVDELCNLAGDSPGPAPALIPTLFPLADPCGVKTNIARTDLLVFIARDRHVMMSRAAADKYNMVRARNAIWFLVNGENPEFAAGEFMPGIAE